MIDLCANVMYIVPIPIHCHNIHSYFFERVFLQLKCPVFHKNPIYLICLSEWRSSVHGELNLFREGALNFPEGPFLIVSNLLVEASKKVHVFKVNLEAANGKLKKQITDDNVENGSALAASIAVCA